MTGTLVLVYWFLGGSLTMGIFQMKLHERGFLGVSIVLMAKYVLERGWL